MSVRCISNESLDTTGFSYTLSLINGKYKMVILYTLMEFGIVRFNEMKKYIGDISYKTLSANLKELEADGLVHDGEMYELHVAGLAREYRTIGLYEITYNWKGGEKLCIDGDQLYIK